MLNKVELNSSLFAEAAIKLVNPDTKLSSKSETSQKLPEEGGGGGDGLGILSYAIEVALNGFLVTITYVEGDIPDEKYVVHTMDEVIEILKGSL